MGWRLVRAAKLNLGEVEHMLLGVHHFYSVLSIPLFSILAYGRAFRGTSPTIPSTKILALVSLLITITQYTSDYLERSYKAMPNIPLLTISSLFLLMIARLRFRYGCPCPRLIVARDQVQSIKEKHVSNIP
jgi:hypothetical protein